MFDPNHENIGKKIHTYTQYKQLAWEPSGAQVSQSYSHRLPALERFYWKLNFRY